MDKQKVREKIWTEMEKRKIATFPLPCYGRIPNFVGAEKAALNLIKTEEWKNAEVIKINPDSPQRKVRELALKEGKVLIIATPRLRKGFILLKNVKDVRKASTIKGAFRFGKLLKLHEIPKVDLIVEGSVAVTEYGARIGKGHGYGELEYAILREMDLVNEKTPIATTVHEIQIVKDEIELDPWDVPVDLIVTPKRIIRTYTKLKRPRGILWEFIEENLLKEIPLLKELKNFLERSS